MTETKSPVRGNKLSAGENHLAENAKQTNVGVGGGGWDGRDHPTLLSGSTEPNLEGSEMSLTSPLLLL